MSIPDGPHVKTTYKVDGSLVVEPHGFGGNLCHAATQPYLEKQGQHTTQPTDESADPTNKAWLSGSTECSRDKVKA